MQNEKQGLKDKMLMDLENKRRKLRDERDNFDIMAGAHSLLHFGYSMRKPADQVLFCGAAASTDGGLDSKSRATRRNPVTKGVGEERKERRRKQQQGPQCPYLLKDSEIHEDLNILRRVSCGSQT